MYVTVDEEKLVLQNYYVYLSTIRGAFVCLT